MVDVAELAVPGRTAVVTSEVQRGVVGNGAVLPDLAVAAEPAVANLARLLVGARAAGIPVVHCTFRRRADGQGASTNAPLFRATARRRGGGADAGVEPVVAPELGPEPGDIVLFRYHGLSPMGNTDLDPILRNLGVSTVVATGVSVNVAVTNLAFDAVNAGYHVVVPRDAVAGYPADYAESMLQNTLAIVAKLTTTDELLAAWTGR